MLKFKDIREAVKTINKGEYVKVFYNVKTCKVWANDYKDAQSFDEANNNPTSDIYAADMFKAFAYDDELSQEMYRRAIAKEQGWTCETLTWAINACIKSDGVFQEKEALCTK